MVGNEEEIKNIWVQHFKNLGNQLIKEENETEIRNESQQQEEEPPSIREIEQIIHNLKNNKSPSEGVPNGRNSKRSVRRLYSTHL